MAILRRSSSCPVRICIGVELTNGWSAHTLVETYRFVMEPVSVTPKKAKGALYHVRTGKFSRQIWKGECLTLVCIWAACNAAWNQRSPQDSTEHALQPWCQHIILLRGSLSQLDLPTHQDQGYKRANFQRGKDTQPLTIFHLGIIVVWFTPPRQNNFYTWLAQFDSKDYRAVPPGNLRQKTRTIWSAKKTMVFGKPKVEK